MAANDRLVYSLFQTLVIAAIAVVLWVSGVSPLPENSPGLDFLLWPVAVATVLALAFDLVFRLQRSPRLRAALGLPEQFRPRVAISLLMARRSLRDASWLALLVGGLVALAGTQAEPQTYYTTIVAAGAILALMAAVRTASIPFPVVDTLFPFPRYRLLALGIVSLLLQHELSYAYGFPNSPLLPALVAATGGKLPGQRVAQFRRCYRAMGRCRRSPPDLDLRVCLSRCKPGRCRQPGVDRVGIDRLFAQRERGGPGPLAGLPHGGGGPRFISATCSKPGTWCWALPWRWALPEDCHQGRQASPERPTVPCSGPRRSSCRAIWHGW